MTANRHIQELDVVELTVEVGRWPAHTRATVLEAFADGVLLEIADERGHTISLPSVPWAAIRPVTAIDQGRLAV